MDDWQIKHGKVIKDFLSFLNDKTDRFILKGGTALKQCYKLDRFSEDIDLDASSGNIKEIVSKFCKANNYRFSIKKDTDLVKRYIIDYGNASKNLKIEISYRRKNINKDELSTINGIKTYNIDVIAAMKSSAYSGRDKLRDLYDMAFITEKYYNELSTPTKLIMQSAIQFKGIEQCEFLLQQQDDPLINPNKLIDKFLNMYEKFELRIDKNEEKKLRPAKEKNTYEMYKDKIQLSSDEQANDIKIIKLMKDDNISERQIQNILLKSNLQKDNKDSDRKKQFTKLIRMASKEHNIER